MTSLRRTTMLVRSGYLLPDGRTKPDQQTNRLARRNGRYQPSRLILPPIHQLRNPLKIPIPPLRNRIAQEDVNILRRRWPKCTGMQVLDVHRMHNRYYPNSPWVPVTLVSRLKSVHQPSSSRPVWTVRQRLCNLNSSSLPPTVNSLCSPNTPKARVSNRSIRWPTSFSR